MEISETIQLKPCNLARFERHQTLPLPKIMRWVWAAITTFIMLATGCISIPEDNWIVSQRSPYEIKRQALDCAVINPEHSSQEQPGLNHKTLPQAMPESGLNAEGFSFVTWNIHKGKTKGWGKDFQKICRSTDILILQEAYLTTDLKTILQQEDLQWDLATAYAYQKIEAGVLTASKVAPNLSLLTQG